MPLIKKQPPPAPSRLRPILDLRPCRYCKRNFASDRVSVHENICRNIQKRRPVFDSAKKRISGTSLEAFHNSGGKKQLQWRRGGGSYSKQKQAPPKNNWRKTHEELIESLRNARAAGRIMKMGGNIADLPPPPPSINPDYIQCPHCQRRFNEAAANRHIPQCANYQHNKPHTNLPQRNIPKIDYPKFRKKNERK